MRNYAKNIVTAKALRLEESSGLSYKHAHIKAKMGQWDQVSSNTYS